MPDKQAVLLIHGIGEQRPMDTLRGFVKAVWTTDKNVQHPHARPGVFSKPDDISDSFELRRLTTTSDRNNVRTDFFEFYWAHLMEGTAIRHVLTWAFRLLFRWPWNVPRQLRAAWFLIVMTLLIAATFVALTVVPEEHQPMALPKWLTVMLGLLTTWLIVPIINSFVGDVARYLDPAPANIKRRQEIRAEGIKVLKKLHDSGEYQRIIVVGHSLGTVIGYDILTYAWPAFAQKETANPQPHPKLDAIEEAVAEQSLDKYRAMQRELLTELQASGCKWLVSDFVTLGSPLTHAEVLLARDLDDLKSKQQERELPTCPPVLEKDKFSFPAERKHRTLHHAAVFGPTRWANLYFPSCYVIRGDLVGGPLADVFGKGILDCPVATSLRRGFFSHTLYWSMETEENPGTHVAALRTALNVLDAA